MFLNCPNRDEDIDEKKSFSKSSAIDFLNSNLGIWMLSTIAVSLFSFGYSYFDAKIKDSFERKNRLSEMRSELINRIDKTLLIVSNEKSLENRFFTAVDLLDNRKDSIYISPNFENASVRHILTKIKYEFPECSTNRIDSVIENLGSASGLIPPLTEDKKVVDSEIRLLALTKIKAAKSEITTLFESCVLK